MSITLNIDLPDQLAERFVALLPEEEQRRFSIAAIADALMFRQDEEGDCTAAVEQALADMDTGIGLISFEDVCHQWEAEKASRKTADWSE